MKKKMLCGIKEEQNKVRSSLKKSLNFNFLKVSLFAGKWFYEHGNILLSVVFTRPYLEIYKRNHSQWINSPDITQQRLANILIYQDRTIVVFLFFFFCSRFISMLTSDLSFVGSQKQKKNSRFAVKFKICYFDSRQVDRPPDFALPWSVFEIICRAASW